MQVLLLLGAVDTSDLGCCSVFPLAKHEIVQARLILQSEASPNNLRGRAVGVFSGHRALMAQEAYKEYSMMLHEGFLKQFIIV